MGIKKGNTESAGLGALAKRANPTYHQHNSVASGLGALASGIKALASGWGAVSDGLKDLGKAFFQYGEYAVKADAQQKDSTKKAGMAQVELDNFVKNHGENAKNLPGYWELRDKVNTYRDMAKHQGLFGIYSSPQPTRQYVDRNGDPDESALSMRAQVLGKDRDGDRVGYGFGGIASWDGELEQAWKK